MNEDKATRYHRLQRWVSVASLAWGLLLSAALIVSQGSLALRGAGEWAASLFGPGLAARVAARSLYVVVLGLVNEIVALPLAFYSGYLVEHRYGLSTQTLVHWGIERVKGLAVAGVFALGAVNLLYLAIDRWPHGWWLPAGAGFAAIIILIANVFPVLLLPLFYTIVPMKREELRSRLLALADHARVPVVNAYEWRVSDRTRKANAALTGLGRTRRILVSDTLLAQYSDDEIEVILAHELGHHAHHDIWKGIALEAVFSLAGFFLAARLLIWLTPAAGLRGPADIAGLPILLLGASAVSLLLLPLANAVSRGHERNADRYALDLTRNAPAFVSAMRRLGTQNLAEEDPSPLVRWLFYSHPPIRERIAIARSADVRRIK